MDLTGKVAIVTGASRGIGKAIAIELAKQGAKVVVAARTQKEPKNIKGTIHQTVDEIRSFGGNAIAVKINDKFIGYVSRENTKNVHQFLKRKNDGDPHILSFYLINKYSSSARWLIIDLTLAMKRNIKAVSK